MKKLKNIQDLIYLIKNNNININYFFENNILILYFSIIITNTTTNTTTTTTTNTNENKTKIKNNSEKSKSYLIKCEIENVNKCPRLFFEKKMNHSFFNSIPDLKTWHFINNNNNNNNNNNIIEWMESTIIIKFPDELLKCYYYTINNNVYYLNNKYKLDGKFYKRSYFINNKNWKKYLLDLQPNDLINTIQDEIQFFNNIKEFIYKQTKYIKNYNIKKEKLLKSQIEFILNPFVILLLQLNKTWSYDITNIILNYIDNLDLLFYLNKMDIFKNNHSLQKIRIEFYNINKFRNRNRNKNMKSK